MNAAGVDRAVIVPPSWEGDRNDLAIDAHLTHPGRFATMGSLDPQEPASRGKIATWREHPGMLGLRFTFHIPQLVSLVTEGHMDWVWGEAEKAGVPIYVLVPHPLVHLIDKVAERSPIPYRQHVSLFTEEIPWLTSEDKEWIMGRGVCEWIEWEVSSLNPFLKASKAR